MSYLCVLEDDKVIRINISEEFRIDLHRPYKQACVVVEKILLPKLLTDDIRFRSYDLKATPSKDDPQCEIFIRNAVIAKFNSIEETPAGSFILENVKIMGDLDLECSTLPELYS